MTPDKLRARRLERALKRDRIARAAQLAAAWNAVYAAPTAKEILIGVAVVIAIGGAFISAVIGVVFYLTN